MNLIDPISLFRREISAIEKPIRYLGGESSSASKSDSILNVALCFPDLYEIGMSNNAMRIIYAKLNNIESISCERVFSVGKDYEDLLRKTNTPLYGLETGLPISEFDFLAFTIGYELLATNILNILELSYIPLEKTDRTDRHPIIIAGGPAITNPLPYARIFDAVWIGEAETLFFDLMYEISLLKKAGASRRDLFLKLIKEDSVWIPGKKTKRHVYEGFSNAIGEFNFPSPVLKPIQNHGVVEIMRGCPNGCRFCHAGYYYRPVRYRNPDSIILDVENLVKKQSYKEISLSSLSSGDYPGIVKLVRILKNLWASQDISFQLPSLKIESFPLELIDEITETRKGGLTFAIETPSQSWQVAINKQVSFKKILNILLEADSKGYKVAKFYFMLGLFDNGQYHEEDMIIELVSNIVANTPHIHLNLTISTFVPKPFTPFQWKSQLEPNEALRRIFKIKDAFKRYNRVKISYHSPYLSWIEGIISRGDERAGDLIMMAFKNGASFDAWDDLFNKPAWEIALGHYPECVSDIMRGKDTTTNLPWSSISLLVSKTFLLTEYHKSNIPELTKVCTSNCSNPCGACSESVKVEDVRIEIESRLNTILASQVDIVHKNYINPNQNRLFFNFEKTDRAAYIPHHDIHTMLCRAFDLSGIKIAFSQGFNPMPRLEISEPLSLGYQSFEEFGLARLNADDSINFDDTIMNEVNSFLHSDMRIKRIRKIQSVAGQRNQSLSSVHWGSIFKISFKEFEKCIKPFESYILRIKSSIPQLVDVQCTIIDSNTVELLLPFTGIRDLGLSSIFAEGLGITIRETGIPVTRIKQFAKGVNNEPISYDEVFLKYPKAAT
jgi:radical SAM superfamily enzyme YgiQ (UPF0313 family)